MRELDSKEIEVVNGGVAPLIGFGLAMISHFGARSAGSWALSRAGTILGAYGLGAYGQD